MEEKETYFRCNQCQDVSKTTLEQGCLACSSKDMVQLKPEEIEKIEDEKSFNGCLIALLIVIPILFLTGQMYFTTQGCTLGFDLVLFGYCIFGSFGASVGATIAATLIFGVIGFILTAIINVFKK